MGIKKHYRIYFLLVISFLVVPFINAAFGYNVIETPTSVAVNVYGDGGNLTSLPDVNITPPPNDNDVVSWDAGQQLWIAEAAAAVGDTNASLCPDDEVLMGDGYCLNLNDTISDLATATSDTNLSEKFDNLTSSDCGTGKVTAVQTNGSLTCADDVDTSYNSTYNAGITSLNLTRTIQLLLNGTNIWFAQVNVSQICIDDVCLSSWAGVNGSATGNTIWPIDDVSLGNKSGDLQINKTWFNNSVDARASSLDTNASGCPDDEVLMGDGYCLDLNATISDLDTDTTIQNASGCPDDEVLMGDGYCLDLNATISDLDTDTTIQNASGCPDNEVLMGDGYCLDLNDTIDDRDDTGAGGKTGASPWLNNDTSNIILNVTNVSLHFNQSGIISRSNDSWTAQIANASGCPNGEYLDGDAQCKDFNASVSAATASISYFPWNVTVQAGTKHAAGNVTNLWTSKDDLNYTVQEDAGSPALTIILNFTDVLDFNSIIMREWYSGGLGHEIEIGLWDFNTNQYEEEYGDITDMDGFAFTIRNVLDSSDHIDGNGNASLRLRHSQAGNTGHVLYLDYVSLVDGFSTITTTKHDSLSGRDNVGNHPLLDSWVQGINTTFAIQSLLNGTNIFFAQTNVSQLCILDVCISSWVGVNGSAITDTNLSEKFDNLTSSTCGTGKVTAVQTNGSLTCATDTTIQNASGCPDDEVLMGDGYCLDLNVTISDLDTDTSYNSTYEAGITSLNLTRTIQTLLNGTSMWFNILNSSQMCIDDICLSSWAGVNGSASVTNCNATGSCVAGNVAYTNFSNYNITATHIYSKNNFTINGSVFWDNGSHIIWD